MHYLLTLLTCYVISAVSTVNAIPFSLRTIKKAFRSAHRPALQVTTTPHWHRYQTPLCQNDAIHICRFTIRTKQPRMLKKIRFYWHTKTGTQLPEKIGVSLYKTPKSKELQPLEKNFINHGIWDHTDQTITFFPEKKIVSLNDYDIVLTCDPSYTPRLRLGTLQYHDYDPATVTTRK